MKYKIYFEYEVDEKDFQGLYYDGGELITLDIGNYGLAFPKKYCKLIKVQQEG